MRTLIKNDMNKKTLITICLTLIATACLMAQNSPDLASPARNFLTNTLRPLYPIVVAGVGLIGGLMNIGKVMGENSDWKGFFTKILLFLASAVILVVALEGLYALTVNF